jgi:hypothetical protein
MQLRAEFLVSPQRHLSCLYEICCFSAKFAIPVVLLQLLLRLHTHLLQLLNLSFALYAVSFGDSAICVPQKVRYQLVLLQLLLYRSAVAAKLLERILYFTRGQNPLSLL